MGYRFDFKNREIIETGVVSIDIRPKEAEVYLNDIRIMKSIPIRLTNRTPGIYNLKISLAGYKTWEKNIDIKSRQTTYIKNITLLKNSLPTSIDGNKENIQAFFPSSDGRFILLAMIENNVTNIELYDSQTNEFSQIFRLPVSTNYQIEWSPFNNYILLIKYNGKNDQLNLMSAENIENIVTYDIVSHEENHLDYQWQKNAPVPTIFTNENDKIYRITTTGNEYIFNHSSSTIWYIDDTEKLWVHDQNNLKIMDSVEAKDNIELKNITNIKKIIDINNNRAVIVTTDQIAIISRNENKQEVIDTSNFQRNPYTNEWLTWSAWELWSIYEHDKPALLNRTSDNIKSVFPLDEVGALAIINNHGIESFNPGYYVSQNLYNGEVYNASVNRRENKIYLFGKVGEKTGLYELGY